MGNQFFQYAAVKSYQKKYCKDEEICLDFSDLKKLGSKKDGFENSLKFFNVPKFRTVNKIKANLFQKILIFIMKVPNAFLRLIGFSKIADRATYKFEKFMQPFLNKFGVFYMIHGYCEFKPTKAKNKIFYGNFESDRFFSNIKDELINYYTPKEKTLEKNKKFLEKIQNNESICISIRRGDFLKKEFSKIHYVCNDEYFYKAVSIIKQEVKNPLFVVFSDDIDWVKKNMNFGADAIYEDGTDPLWEKVRLMSSCKHFIISNSTFSWWTQYLSKNKNKIVIAPMYWKKIAYKKDTSKLDIYEDFWKRI